MILNFIEEIELNFLHTYPFLLACLAIYRLNKIFDFYSFSCKSFYFNMLKIKNLIYFLSKNRVLARYVLISYRDSPLRAEILSCGGDSP